MPPPRHALGPQFLRRTLRGQHENPLPGNLERGPLAFQPDARDVGFGLDDDGAALNLRCGLEACSGLALRQCGHGVVLLSHPHYTESLDVACEMASGEIDSEGLTGRNRGLDFR